MFEYQDGHQIQCSRISTVQYETSKLITVEEDELATHNFPLNREIHLTGDQVNYTVSPDGLRAIFIAKG